MATRKDQQQEIDDLNSSITSLGSALNEANSAYERFMRKMSESRGILNETTSSFARFEEKIAGIAANNEKLNSTLEKTLSIQADLKRGANETSTALRGQGSAVSNLARLFKQNMKTFTEASRIEFNPHPKSAARDIRKRVKDSIQTVREAAKATTAANVASVESSNQVANGARDITNAVRERLAATREAANQETQIQAVSNRTWLERVKERVKSGEALIEQFKQLDSSGKRQIDNLQTLAKEYGSNSREVAEFVEGQKELLEKDSFVTEEKKSSLQVLVDWIKYLGETSEKNDHLAASFVSLARAINPFKKETDEATAALDKANAAKKGTPVFVQRIVRRFKEWEKTNIALGATIRMVAKSLMVLKAAVGAVLGLLGSVLKFIVNLATAIIALPFKIVGALTRISQQMSEINADLQRSVNSLRGSFGSLTEGAGQDVIRLTRVTRNSTNELSNYAASSVALWGRFENAIKARNEAAGRLMEGLGSMAEMFRRELGAIGETGDFDVFETIRRGLAITESELEGLARQAAHDGRTIYDQLQSIATVSMTLGDRFGVTSRFISRDITTMRQDFGNFGTFTDYQLGRMSVSARRLGIEIKDLTGMFSKFDDFEGAAESAAMLGQAFGMNVDAMQLMMEEDPTARLRQLQQAFAQTGRSFQDLTRREQALLAQQAGLTTTEAASRAFSIQGMAMSFEELEEASPQDPMVSLTEAVNRLSSSFDAIVDPLHAESFFAMFQQGFMRGLTRANEFQELWGEILQLMERVHTFGMQLGKMLAESPIVRDLVVLLTEFIKNLDDEFFSRMIGHIETLLTMLHEPDQIGTALSTFFTNIMGEFRDTFRRTLTELGRSGSENFWVNLFSTEGETQSLLERFGNSLKEMASDALSEILLPIWRELWGLVWQEGAGASNSGGVLNQFLWHLKEWGTMFLAGLAAILAVSTGGAAAARGGLWLGARILSFIGPPFASVGSALLAWSGSILAKIPFVTTAINGITGAFAAGKVALIAGFAAFKAKIIGLGAVLAGAAVLPFVAALGAALAGLAIGTLIRRWILDPWAASGRRIRDEYAAMQTQALEEERRNLHWYQWRKRGILEEELADRERTNNLATQMRESQDSNRAAIDAARVSHGGDAAAALARELENARRRVQAEMGPRTESSSILGVRFTRERYTSEEFQRRVDEAQAQIRSQPLTLTIAPPPAPEVRQIGSGVTQGIAQGAQEESRAGMQIVGGSLIDNLGDSLIMRSPSRRAAEEIGVPFAQGIAMGIESQSLLLRTSVLDSLQEASGAALIEGVNRIVDEHRKLDSLLARGIPAVSLSGTLSRFNQAMTIARESIRIENSPINLNLTVNVTLDADELIDELSSEVREVRLLREG